jgi:hypothetical protein
MNPRVALLLLWPSLVGTTLAAPSARAEAVPPPASKPAPKPPAVPLRPVDDILKDVVKALGGAEAMGKHKSVRTKMTITFQGLGISGTAEHIAAVGDKALTITNIPNVASTREGCDGTRSWSHDPINGLRILTDIEAEQSRIEAIWNAELRLKELYPKIDVTSEVAADGTRLECLVLTAKVGPPMTDCFDAKTHLLATQRGVRSGPQGETPFAARLTDWRAVGDIKMAFRTEMQVGPLSFVGTVTSAELDVPIDASVFAVPAPPAPSTDGAGGGSGKAKAAKAAKATKAAKPARAPTDAAAKSGAPKADAPAKSDGPKAAPPTGTAPAAR